MASPAHGTFSDYIKDNISTLRPFVTIEEMEGDRVVTCYKFERQPLYTLCTTKVPSDDFALQNDTLYQFEYKDKRFYVNNARYDEEIERSCADYLKSQLVSHGNEHRSWGITINWVNCARRRDGRFYSAVYKYDNGTLTFVSGDRH